MMFTRRLRMAGFALALAAFGLAGAGQAQQAFPSRPITVIVPAAAGGPTDAVARILAEAMSRDLGQPVVVENVGGAGGTIGSLRVARARPDGYTLLVWHIAHATAPALYPRLQYDVLADFAPIGRILDAPMMLVGRTDHPARNVADLLAWIRAKRGDVSYGHAGIGTASHLCGMLLNSALGTQMTGVPYRGTGPAMNDLFAGQLDVMCDQTSNTTEPVNAGRILGYATASRSRLPTFPALPTVDESGLRDFEMSAWHALWAPRGTPEPVVQHLVASLQTALEDDKVRERFSQLGVIRATPEQATPAGLRSHHEAEVAKWGALIKAAGVRAE